MRFCTGIVFTAAVPERSIEDGVLLRGILTLRQVRRVRRVHCQVFISSRDWQLSLGSWDVQIRVQADAGRFVQKNIQQRNKKKILYVCHVFLRFCVCYRRLACYEATLQNLPG